MILYRLVLPSNSYTSVLVARVRSRRPASPKRFRSSCVGFLCHGGAARFGLMGGLIRLMAECITISSMGSFATMR